jgi:3',5'-cyclic AMP phosphodiesterase CpdA
MERVKRSSFCPLYVREFVWNLEKHMKLYAISDLHIGCQANREALIALPSYPEDWLIIAGDLGETVEQYHYALSHLSKRFARLVWVPGNHDLWTLPSKSREEREGRGEEKYRKLVAICREYNVLTPEDPYIVWPGEGLSALIVPLFLLYDYSFRPADIPLEGALAWAEETDILCTDEALLHPDPYPSRIDWCQARCAATEQRLQKEIAGRPVIFINHFPLRQALVRFKSIPRFSLWCGTRQTEDWHTRFPAAVAVYGHLHMRATDYQDGVRFEEVSLGYPQQWKHERGIDGYFREVLPGSAAEAEPLSAGPFWHW